MTAPDQWNAEAEAAEAFALTDRVEAVVFSTDLAIGNKLRGKTRRKHDKLFRALRQLLADGQIEKARLAVEQAVWPGAQGAFWLTSIEELAQKIDDHLTICRRNRFLDAIYVNVSEDPRVVLYDLWRDR